MKGIKINVTYLNYLQFADNNVFITENFGELKTTIKRVTGCFSSYSFGKLALVKPKYLTQITNF